MAWPKVWPKLKMARNPDSRSSWPTTRALISHDRWTAYVSGRVVARDQQVEVGLDPVQKRSVGNRSVLDDLSESRRDLTLRKRFKSIEIAITSNRLVERADHVLAKRMVYRRLASHRRVDLRQAASLEPARTDTPRM